MRFQTKIGESLHRWMHISPFESSMKKAAKTFKTPDGVHIHSFHIFFHSSFHHTFSFRFTYYCTYATSHVGKEFNTRAEWRDYMVLNFYSFKNKIGEAETLIKPPGSIDGQGKCASVPVVCVYLASKDHIRT